jgi:hypothetical protein
MLNSTIYYTALTLWKYPDKEVFGIRTEHELDDMVAVDKLVGGSGEFINRGKQSHVSEHYLPSSLFSKRPAGSSAVFYPEKLRSTWTSSMYPSIRIERSKEKQRTDFVNSVASPQICRGGSGKHTVRSC